MKTGNVLLAAAAGTAAMTGFSYFLSAKKDKEFKEPKLLGKMVNRAFPSIGKTSAELTGWMLHASMGLMFTIVYQQLIKELHFRRNLPNDIFIGVVNGVAGIIIWKLTFSLHPDPPKIHFSRFYGHLILAHIIFSTTALSAMDEKSIYSKQRNLSDFNLDSITTKTGCRSVVQTW